MPINFLGDKSKPLPNVKSETPVEWHQPEAEARAKREKIKKVEQPPVTQSVEIPPSHEVNFMSSFSQHLWKKRLILLGLIVFIVSAGIYGYFRFFYSVAPSAPTNLAVLNLNQPLVIPPVNQPPSQPPVVPLVEPPITDSVVLPDTELAPLRGAVIKFKNESIIYLVERNGELRRANLTNVVFLNGQKITQINPNLVYVIADKFKTIRRGKDVYGQVDWDPRILTYQELQPFLQ